MHELMASSASPILGVWYDPTAKRRTVENVAQWVTVGAALASILISVQTKRK